MSKLTAIPLQKKKKEHIEIMNQENVILENDVINMTTKKNYVLT